MKRLLVAALLLGACVESGVVHCEDGRLCPAGLECDDVHGKCVRPEQKTECAGEDDFTTCDVEGIDDPTCYDGVCLPGGCGNERMDPLEVCDDGNAVSGDGCAADCLSDEKCGNGVPDVVNAEACDDGNPVGHDGCASACSLESPRWLAIQPQPPPRKRTAMTYDAHRRRVVMFGGEHRDSQFTIPYRRGDTWLWDGIRWTEMAPAVSPAARRNAAMAWDPNRQVAVLFGGDDNGPFGDTWEWDGASWALMEPASDSPPPREQGGMAFDPERGRIVLVGGLGVRDTWEWDGLAWQAFTAGAQPPAGAPVVAYDPGRGALVAFIAGETWERVGTTWSDVTPASGSPPTLDDAAMAYDTVNRVVVMHGGGSTEGQTWAWNGTAWAMLSGAGPLRTQHAMTGDIARGRVVLFGGTAGSDTWEWNGTAWAKVADLAAPAPRYGAAAALDVHGDLVVYGGDDAQLNTFDDTWVWRGLWIERLATSPPGPRSGAAMAYDPVHGETVMYGGSDTADLWIWDGEAWTPRTPATSPGPLTGASMVWDEARQQIVMFGLDRTWVWNGTDWSDVTPTLSPPARVAAGIAYDPYRQRVVLFGGLSVIDAPLGDTWEWDGSTWQERTPAASPPPRDAPAMAWDAARGRVVVFGGRATLNQARSDAWEWDGTHWVQSTAPPLPPARTAATMFSAPDGAGVLLFGGGVMGGDLSGGIVDALGDLWRLRWDGTHADESCIEGGDVDGDLLDGCDDPDCWVGCAACGDGTCDPLREGCAICPSDCGECPLRCGDFRCEGSETSSDCPGDC